MFQPLYVAATGLDTFENEILNITNNLSNAKTVAYKKDRTEMESLFFVDKTFKQRLSDAQAMQDDLIPSVSPEFGTGVRVTATTKDFSQGAMEVTNKPLDIAIQGDGFFQFKMPDGSAAYSRAGNLHSDNEGNLVDPNGRILDPALTLPSGTTAIVIRTDGMVYASVNNSLTPTEVGQINLVRFPNPAGLSSIGQNLYAATAASGDAILGTAGQDGYGSINQYSLESSNVEVLSEMMRMVMAQRVFDTITKAVQTYEGMLASLEKMKG